MPTRWVLGAAVAFVLALTALAFYFTRSNPASSPARLNQIARSEITRSDESQENPASASNRVSEGSSRTSATSRRVNESLGGKGKAFYDFSGIATIDPDSPSTAPTPQNSPEPKEEPKSALPMVFQPVDPKLLQLTPEQQKVIDRLKQSFLDMMGSAPQDPNDPKYAEQWEVARPLIDQQLQAQLGLDFFLRYEIAMTARTKR